MVSSELISWSYTIEIYFLQIISQHWAPIYKALMIPYELLSHQRTCFSRDQACKLQASFFWNYIRCLSWQWTWRQFMKSTATKVMQCLLGVLHSHWLQFSSPSAWGYLRGHRANCFSICVCCYKQQAGIDRYLLQLPATLVFLLL